MLDAATGEPAVDAPADLKPVRINNRLRRAIDAALGGLTLLSPDPKQRLERRAGRVQVARRRALPALDAAIAKETDPTHQARAGRSARRHHSVQGRMPPRPRRSKPSA